MTTNPEYNYGLALFSIEAQSNLHVGSSSENYGIIDNLVQRDAATGFPCINASSLKGALREYCENYLGGPGNRGEMIKYIFGTDKRESDDASPSALQAGNYRFLGADLLPIPVRADDTPYLLATCPALLKQVSDLVSRFGYQFKDAWINGLLALTIPAATEGVAIGRGPVNIELDEPATLQAQPGFSVSAGAAKMMGNQFVLLKDEQMAVLCSDYNLPVIARNSLNDGWSENLWYEQVLPRYSKLVFGVLYPRKDSYIDQFTAAITSFPVQIGGNASVGYGFCSIESIEIVQKGQVS